MLLSMSRVQIDRDFWLSVGALAVPVALQTLLQSLLGMADILMVGVLGKSAIAAVGLSAKIHFLLLVAMNGLATGCSVLVAQYYGAKKLGECRLIVALTILVGVVFMAPFTLAFGVFSDSWVPWINPDSEVTALAASYLTITAPVLLLLQAVVIYEASLRALGNMRAPLICSALSILINIVLNYALIGGNWGFPALGVEGAAWATLIARCFHLVMLLIAVYASKHAFALRPSDFVGACTPERFRYFIVFTLPLIANYTFWGVGNTTYHVLTGYAGTEALAVMGVLVPIEMCFFSLFVGFASAAAILVGQSLGGGNMKKAWSLYKQFDQMVIAAVVVLSLLLWLGRYNVVQLFDQIDENTRGLLIDTLAVFCIGVWLKIVNFIRIVGILRAGGDNKFCFYIDMVVMWCAGIPLYAVSVFSGAFSFVTLYMLMFVEDALKFIPVKRRLEGKYWLKNLAEDGNEPSSEGDEAGSSR